MDDFPSLASAVWNKYELVSPVVKALTNAHGAPAATVGVLSSIVLLNFLLRLLLHFSCIHFATCR